MLQTNSSNCLSLAKRLNQVRLARAVTLLSPLQRHLLYLLPSLFQHHQRNLPGYNGPLTLTGIAEYQETEQQLEAFEALGLTPPEETSGMPALMGVYTMGSTGSFGQKRASDIDVWLVHESQLSVIELERLRDKADLLTQWFSQYQLEVNFYLIHPQQFMSENLPEGLDLTLGHEHSGSAQRWLLLEEFYRSQICLAGKTVAWWPDANETEGLLYLGDVHQVPASEYFGAALWQLYKGLEKPHKALLKVMLLEVYSSRYPKTKLISDEIWQRTLTGDFSAGNDHYFLLYEIIELYLLEQQDQRRLELVRRCFYLKCGIHLTDTQQAIDWRYHKLKSLINRWQWTPNLLQTLDNCRHWHSGQLQWFNLQLNELMLLSYQNLLQFASHRRLCSDMRIDELGMLTRKLHTYFNEDNSQLTRFNSLWSENVAEDKLLIVHDQGFRLLRCVSADEEKTSSILLFHSQHLGAILFWACINGVAQPHTQWFRRTKEKQILDKKLTQTTRLLLKELSDSVAKVSKQDLCNPWHFRQVVCLLNIESDPTLDWQGQEEMVDRMNANVFSLGRNRTNMLGTLDVLCINNWGEYHCQHYTGEQALLKSLVYIAPGLRRAKDDVRLGVISHSQRLTNQLSHTVVNLLRQGARLSRRFNTSTTSMQPVQIGSVRYGLFYNSQGLQWQNLSDAKSLYQQLVKGFLVELPRPDLADAPLASLPDAIQRYATCGVTQYFLYQQGEDLDIFVLDELNQQRHFVQKNSDIADMVAKISHQFVFDEHHAPQGRFNMPQFFRLQREHGDLTLAPFGVAPEDMPQEF